MEDVALATIGGRPASVMAPKVRKVPPPATALTALDRNPATNSRMAVDMDMTLLQR
ncbi:hypothetical protein D3C87_2001940 [compost metagenome]